MNRFQVIASMKAIHKYASPTKSTLGMVPKSMSDQVLKNEQFEGLCSRAFQLVDTMDLSQLHSLLNCLLLFSVPIESKILNQVLFAVNKRLYDFQLYEISHIDSALKHLANTLDQPHDEIETIRLAIPYVFQKKFNLEDSNLDSLIAKFNSLDVSEEKKFLVIDLFKSIHIRRHELTHNQCVGTLAGIIRVRDDLLVLNYEMTAELINHCLDKLSETDLEFSEILFVYIFTRLFKKIKVNYHHKWFEKASAIFKIRAKTEPLFNVGEIIDVFNKNNYVDLELIRLYQERLLKSTMDVESVYIGDLMNEFGILARLTQYIPLTEYNDEEKSTLIHRFKAVYDRRDELSALGHVDCLLRIAQARDHFFELDPELTVNMVNHCLQVISEKNPDVPDSTFAYIFMKLLKRIAAKYEHKIFERAARIFKKTHQNLPLSYLELGLTVLDKYAYIDLHLLKVYEERILNRNVIFDGDKLKWHTALRLLTSVPQYSPIAGWDPLVNCIIDNFESYRNEIQTRMLINSAFDLATIEKFPGVIYTELCERIESQPNLLDEFRIPTLRNLLYVNIALHQRENLPDQAIKLKELLPPIVEKAIQTFHSINQENSSQNMCQVYNVLTDALGDTNCVSPVVWTKYGLEIPNLIIFNKEKRPVKTFEGMNLEELVFLEPINKPQDCVFLSVMPLTSSEVSKRGYIRRSCNFRLKSMRHVGIRPVTFDLNVFSQLEKSNANEFLLSIIKKDLQNIL